MINFPSDVQKVANILPNSPKDVPIVQLGQKMASLNQNILEYGERKF